MTQPATPTLASIPSILDMRGKRRHHSTFFFTQFYVVLLETFQ